MCGAVPATMGVDMDVPLIPMVAQLEREDAARWRSGGAAYADMMTDTGATRSGVKRPSQVGPWDENQATVIRS